MRYDVRIGNALRLREALPVDLCDVGLRAECAAGSAGGTQTVISVVTMC